MDIAQPSKRITQCPTFAECQLKGSDFVGGVLKSSYTTIVEQRIAVVGSQLVILLSIVSFRNVYSMSTMP